MPGLYRYLIIAPSADQAGVQSATGFHTNTDVYVAADPSPRTKWGGWTATAFSAAQETAIETPTTGARATFPASTFIKYHATNPNDPTWPKIVPAQELANDRSGEGQHPPLTTIQTDP